MDCHATEEADVGGQVSRAVATVSTSRRRRRYLALVRAFGETATHRAASPGKALTGAFEKARFAAWVNERIERLTGWRSTDFRWRPPRTVQMGAASTRVVEPREFTVQILGLAWVSVGQQVDIDGATFDVVEVHSAAGVVTLRGPVERRAAAVRCVSREARTRDERRISEL